MYDLQSNKLLHTSKFFSLWQHTSPQRQEKTKMDGRNNCCIFRDNLHSASVWETTVFSSSSVEFDN